MRSKIAPRSAASGRTRSHCSAPADAEGLSAGGLQSGDPVEDRAQDDEQHDEQQPEPQRRRSDPARRGALDDLGLGGEHPLLSRTAPHTHVFARRAGRLFTAADLPAPTRSSSWWWSKSVARRFGDEPPLDRRPLAAVALAPDPDVDLVRRLDGPPMWRPMRCVTSSRTMTCAGSRSGRRDGPWARSGGRGEGRCPSAHGVSELDALDQPELVERLEVLIGTRHDLVGDGAVAGAGDRDGEQHRVDGDELALGTHHHPDRGCLGRDPRGRTELCSLRSQHVELLLGAADRSFDGVDLELALGDPGVQADRSHHHRRHQHRQRHGEPRESTAGRHDGELATTVDVTGSMRSTEAR